VKTFENAKYWMPQSWFARFADYIGIKPPVPVRRGHLAFVLQTEVQGSWMVGDAVAGTGILPAEGY